MTTDPPPPPGLKLRAEDADDLAVISACLQDSLVSLRDLAYDPAQQTFMFVANRFRWERGAAAPAGETGFERVLCGVAFQEVTGVSYRGFRRSHEDRILSLLAVRAEPRRDGTVIHLDFAAGAEIRLMTARVRSYARDLSEPWPTAWQPRHSADEPA